MSAPWESTAARIAERIASGELSASEATASVLERIDAVDERVGAYVRVDREAAEARAAELDARRAAGESLGPLGGVPIGLKDLIAQRHSATTCGSRILEGFEAPYDAGVVERLEAAGAVLVGKLNMDEFAMGSSTEHSHHGLTRNPWDLERVPGGSSGGSAAAVASGSCVAALGSDTGGSIRQPASFCGVVGLKPTYGRVSRYGLVAFASSLDQIGPLTRTMEDAALMTEVLCGHDPRDSTSLDAPAPVLRPELERGIEKLRLGVPREAFGAGIDAEVEATVRGAIERLGAESAEIVEVDLPHTRYGIATYYILAPAEASSNLARYDGVRYGHRSAEAADLGELYRRSRTEGFGEEVQRRILIGTYVLSAGYYDAYYRKAQQVRTLIRRDYDQAFEHCDALVLPVAPTPAFRIGEMDEDPLQLYLSDVLTVGVNLAGLPGLSVPAGRSSTGLPIGLQVIAPALREDTLIRVGAAWERHSGLAGAIAPLDGATP